MTGFYTIPHNVRNLTPSWFRISFLCIRVPLSLLFNIHDTQTQTFCLSLLISFVSYVSRATIQAKPRRKDGENSELSLEPSLSFEANTENSITDDIISSSASETTEKEPKFHNFIPIPVIDWLQSSLVNKFAPPKPIMNPRRFQRNWSLVYMTLGLWRRRLRKVILTVCQGSW